MEPIPRVAARVLPVSPDGEVLLLQALAADGGAIADDLPDLMAKALRAIR